MNSATVSPIPPEPAPVPARRDLPDFAAFRDAGGHAVSFFFSLQSIPDKSHHTEVALVRDLVRREQQRFSREKIPGLAEDLESVLALADEVKGNPRWWTGLYACSQQRFRRRFELPAPKSIRQLHIGGRLLLGPVLWALNACARYCVLIFERGRARIFFVQGLQIREPSIGLPKENITLHVLGSRSASEKHREHHAETHVTTYSRKLAERVRAFLAEEKVSELVIGCHDDLWGEAEPAFAGFEKGLLIGRFVPADFEMPAAEVRDATYPIFEEHRSNAGLALLRTISDDVSHAAVGVNAVLERLLEARIWKLLLGRPVEGTVSECDNCGRLQPPGAQSCIVCGSTSFHAVPAEEGLIRQAVLTNAEVLTFDQGELPGFRGAAALVRY